MPAAYAAEQPPIQIVAQTTTHHRHLRRPRVVQVLREAVGVGPVAVVVAEALAAAEVAVVVRGILLIPILEA